MVTRVRAGDLDAAETLLSRYQDVAYTAALRLLGEPSDAEDLAQEALIRAYTRLEELQEHASFSAWLRRIAVNLSLNVLRRRGLLQFESLDEPASGRTRGVREFVDERQATPEELALTGELRGEIETFVRLLPPEQRVAVVLRDMYGYDVNEIANLQRCGVSAAKMRIVRGRAHLRRLLSEAQGFEGVEGVSDGT